MASLGEQTVGSIVKLNVNGTARNFIVVHQGLPSSVYDSSCDGTWLLMEEVYESRTFDASEHDYGNSDIHIYLTDTFVNLFDSDINSVIKQVKLPYRKGAGTSTTVTSGSNGLSAKVFLPSFTEVGRSGDSSAPVEGTVLGYFNGATNSKRIAKLNGTAVKWWLRTPGINRKSNAFYVDTNGSSNNWYVYNSAGLRPALVLPYELNVADDGLIDGSIASSGGISGQVAINGVMCELTGEGYVNINGVLCPISDSGVNIGGIINSTKG